MLCFGLRDNLALIVVSKAVEHHPVETTHLADAPGGFVKKSRERARGVETISQPGNNLVEIEEPCPVQELPAPAPERRNRRGDGQSRPTYLLRVWRRAGVLLDCCPAVDGGKSEANLLHLFRARKLDRSCPSSRSGEIPRNRLIFSLTCTIFSSGSRKIKSSP